MTLPLNAKKVFTGEIFNVYQWEQKMYDGSTATFERVSRPNTVQVLATQDNNILVTHEEQPDKGPFFSLCGGRVDEGEDTLAAAKRELLEEAGMVSEDWELYVQHKPTHKIEWYVYYYVAKNCKKVAEQTLDAGEKITVESVTFDEFYTLMTSDKSRDLFLKIQLLQKKDIIQKMLFK